MPLEALKNYVESAKSLTHLWELLNLSGYSVEVYKRVLEERGVDYTEVRKRGSLLRKGQITKRSPTGRIWGLSGVERAKKLIEKHGPEIFCENSIWDGAKARRFIRTWNKELHLLVEKCCECGTPPFWNGKPLTLQIDHKNGISTDNRLEVNLRYICPNCHTQTENWGGANRGKKGADFYARSELGKRKL